MLSYGSLPPAIVAAHVVAVNSALRRIPIKLNRTTPWMPPKKPWPTRVDNRTIRRVIAAAAAARIGGLSPRGNRPLDARES
jgi:hypothetical protein